VAPERRKAIYIYLPESLHTAVKDVASSTRVSLTTVIWRATERYMMDEFDFVPSDTGKLP
jgi:hypothetical protein